MPHENGCYREPYNLPTIVYPLAISLSRNAPGKWELVDGGGNVLCESDRYEFLEWLTRK